MDPSLHKSSDRLSRTMKAVFVAVALLLAMSSLPESQSLSSGAPATPALCSSMIPEHHTGEQTSPSPYTIHLDKSDVTGGQVVRVTLSSLDKRTPFKGFLVMGQKFKDQKLERVETPVGKFGFGSSSSSNIAQIISCEGQNAVTHKDGQNKIEVVLEWTAPNQDAEYMIVATFVKSFDTFWVRQPSAKIRVKKDASVVAQEAPKPVAPKLSQSVLAKLQDFYSGCTTVKGCYGLPNGCVETQDCDMLTTFRVEGARYVFQVTGQLPEGHSDSGYVASGLSFDAAMGTDSIIGCVLTANANVEVLSFYSEGTAIKPLQNFTAGLDSGSLAGQIIGNRVFCEFSRVPELNIEEIQARFNLENQDYFVLMASGVGSINENLHYHASDHGFSACPLSLSTNNTSLANEVLLQDEFYDGCGVTKGCFGLPDYRCIYDKNCQLFVSFDKYFNFQIMGTVEDSSSYVAVGLSFDIKMGNDSVTACVYNDDGNAEVRAYFNLGHSNTPMLDPSAGIASTKSAAFANGILACEFQRTSVLESEEFVGKFDLLNDEYYLLLAKGSLNPDFSLVRHAREGRGASIENVLLSETINIGEPTDPLDKFFGNCGVTKGCFGLPTYRCIRNRDCQLFVSFDKDFNFQILGQVEASANSYVAVGLSFDDKMGKDSVIACTYNAGTAEVRSYYNPSYFNNPLADPGAGIASVQSSEFNNGLLSCEFTRTPLFESEEFEEKFDLLNDEYFLLLATGAIDSDLNLRPHSTKQASSESVFLSETINIGEPEEEDPSDEFYDGCGETKGCWGLPSYECIETRNCDMFVSFDKEFNFQLSGVMENPGDGYLALGLSFDKGMDQDSVTGCVYLNGETEVKSYYNAPDNHENRLMKNETDGIASVNRTGYANGKIYCEFKRTPVLDSPTELQTTFDLTKDLYYLLLAQGGVNADWTLVYHSTKASSPTSGLLSNLVIIGKPVEYIENFYGGCGVTKSCLGLPNYNCIYSRNCEMFVSFDSNFNFQMIGKQLEVADGYVAVGLSFDDTMGDDSVVACVYAGGSIEISSYYNQGHSNHKMTDPRAGIVGIGEFQGYSNGEIYCEFQRTPTLVIDEISSNFNLTNDEYYLLVARGLVQDDGSLARHDDKEVSSEIVILPGTPVIIGAPINRNDKFYDGCGLTKGCFGLPNYQCVIDRNCQMFVSFDKDMNFQIMGTPESTGTARYIAVGLSFDPEMGTDSVIGCVHQQPVVKVISYYNTPTGKSNLKMKDEMDGVVSTGSAVYENGQIYCEYKRHPVQDSPDEIGATFNLETDLYYILLAQGGVKEDWTLHQHTASKASSATAVHMTDAVIVDAPLELIDQFYAGCGVYKGCFGIPAFCVSFRNCDTFVTFDKNLNFQLAGKLPAGSTKGHVSVGLSFDNQMGQDLVTGCAFTEASDSAVQINSYYNVPNEKNNLIMQDRQDGLMSTKGEFTDGILYCQFTRAPLLNSSSSETELDATFDLETDMYHILLAKAAEVTVGDDGVIETLGKHATEDRAASPESVYLNETAVIGEDVDLSFEDFYKGCTTSKGCFGLPIGCVEEENCLMFASFDSTYRFQVAGLLPDQPGPAGHVSVGLSFDDKMGSDSVIGCVWKDGVVKAKSYYNLQNGKNNAKMINEAAGLVNLAVGKYEDGYVFCEFTRTEKLVDSNNEIGHDIDLLNGKFHILLARASSVPPIAEPNGEKLGYHVGAGDKGVSAQAVPMTFIGILKARSAILIELHGGFMVVAWLMCASTGMFTARYYKQTHTDKNPLNKAFWFLLHISCMFATAFMTACGIIFIVIEVGGYSDGLTGPASWHPILGIILTALAGLQVIIAFFRPHPGTPNRPYFNWIHWTIGNSAHIVGIACIFLAQKLSKTGLDENLGYLGVVVGFVIFHVVMHVVMSIHTVWADKQLDIQNKMRAVRPGPMKPSGKSEEAPGTGFRTFMLALYLAGTAGVAIALVVMVAIAV